VIVRVDFCGTLDPAEGCSSIVEADARCPLGKVVLGGGYNMTTLSHSVLMLESNPFDGNRWHILLENNDIGAGGNVLAYAICANAS
jgi:hypothetical protein